VDTKVWEGKANGFGTESVKLVCKREWIETAPSHQNSDP